MAQKAKPGEPTLLELVSQGKIRTSEDIPELSESEIFSEWVLPAVTGASAETEDYKPGALDLALTIPVVGGSIKTGFKLAKEAAKKVGRILNTPSYGTDIPFWKFTNTRALASDVGEEIVDKYRESVRPRIAPEKDDLLRIRERTDEIVAESERLQRQWGTVMPEPEVDIGPAARVENISNRLRQQLDDMMQRLGGEPQAYQRGTYASQRNPLLDADDAIPSPGLSSFTPEQSIQHIIDSTEGQIRGGVSGGSLTWNQARQIYDDIGREGFDEFKSDILSMPEDAREAAVDNFMAKYKLSSGTLSGQQASAVYKQTRFTSDMPDQVISTSRGSTKLEVKTYKIGENTSTIRIEMEPLNPKSIYRKPSAYADFKIKKVRTPDGQTFDRVSDIKFYGTAGRYVNDAGEMVYPGQKYAGLIMRELLNKVPPNTIVDESLLTYDSLYGLIKTAMRTDSKIIFNNPVLKRQTTQGSGPSEMSPITKKWVEMTESGIADDEATEAVISQLNAMIHKHMKKGLVEGVPDFKIDHMSSERGHIRYNPITVHKLGALVAGAFGFKNREEFMKFLEHDPDSVESQVFDNDFSI